MALKQKHGRLRVTENSHRNGPAPLPFTCGSALHTLCHDANLVSSGQMASDASQSAIDRNGLTWRTLTLQSVGRCVSGDARRRWSRGTWRSCVLLSRETRENCLASGFQENGPLLRGQALWIPAVLSEPLQLDGV